MSTLLHIKTMHKESTNIALRYKWQIKTLGGYGGARVKKQKKQIKQERHEDGECHWKSNAVVICKWALRNNRTRYGIIERKETHGINDCLACACMSSQLHLTKFSETTLQ